MAEQAKPRISNFTKFFVPGLAIGLAVGGLAGAYFSSSLDAPSMQPVMPKGHSAGSASHPTGRPDDASAPAPQSPKAPASTGSTGPTSATGSTGSAPTPK
jgi:hypothetical protein